LRFCNRGVITDIVRELQIEGWKDRAGGPGGDLPVLAEVIMRFGEYSTHERGNAPEEYEVRLRIDFTQLDTETDPEAEAA
jgi:hypothetical protein